MGLRVTRSTGTSNGPPSPLPSAPGTTWTRRSVTPRHTDQGYCEACKVYHSPAARSPAPTADAARLFRPPAGVRLPTPTRPMQDCPPWTVRRPAERAAQRCALRALTWPHHTHDHLAIARPPRAPRLNPGSAAPPCPGSADTQRSEPARGAPARRHQRIPAGTPTTTAASSQPTIAVVGGSLTGPTVALLLLHAGFDDVTVYEAVPASAPQGGGLIGLEHSALDILDRLGMASPS